MAGDTASRARLCMRIAYLFLCLGLFFMSVQGFAQQSRSAVISDFWLKAALSMGVMRFSRHILQMVKTR